MNIENISWSPVKDIELRFKRGVGFEDLLRSRYIATIKHPKRAGQFLYLFYRMNHVWVIPFVIGARRVFLKTAYPSRKYTRLCRKGHL